MGKNKVPIYRAQYYVQFQAPTGVLHMPNEVYFGEFEKNSIECAKLNVHFIR